MALTLAQARALVFAYLRRHAAERSHADQLNLIGGRREWADLADSLGFALEEVDLSTVQQVFHDLYLERLIIPGAGPRSSNAAMEWPFYRITEYGRQMLHNSEYAPHDPDGYLSRLQREIPRVDAVILRYLEEALGCYRSDFLLAAAVMTGCAAEKAILLLVDAYGKAIADSAKKAKFEKDTQSWVISRKYDAFWKGIQPTVPNLPASLGDDLHTILDRTFDLIRTTRNDAGHPAGKPPDRDAVHANLILFPAYCRRVYALVDYFGKSPTI